MTRPARYAALVSAVRRAGRMARHHADYKRINPMLDAWNRMMRLNEARDRIMALARQELAQ